MSLTEFLLFSNGYLRLWELVTKTKSLVEGKDLFHNRIERERDFVNYKWITRKGIPYLMVLSKNNTLRYMEMDPKKEVPKEPVEFKIDYSNMDIRLVHPSKSFSKDVDDTFGFDNMGDNEKNDKELMAADEAREPNFHIYNSTENKIGKAPRDVHTTAFDANSEGFVVASSGGILSYFKFPEQGKHKEKRINFYNLHSYQIANLKNDKITQVFTDNGNFKLLSLILKNETTVGKSSFRGGMLSMYFLISPAEKKMCDSRSSFQLATTIARFTVSQSAEQEVFLQPLDKTMSSEYGPMTRFSEVKREPSSRSPNKRILSVFLFILSASSWRWHTLTDTECTHFCKKISSWSRSRI